MKPRSLRLKLTLWFALFFLALTICSSYFTYYEMGALVSAELNSSLISMARIEGATFSDKAPPDIESLTQRAGRFPRYMRQFVQVIDETGEVVSQSGLHNISSPALDTSEREDVLTGENITADLLLEDQPFRIAAVSTERDGKRFVVVVGARLEGFRNTRSNTALLLVAVSLVTIVIAIAGGYVIIRRALKPVDHITERAHQIGAGALHQRLEYIDSSSEMAHLTSVLNEMLDKIDNLFESQKQFVQDAAHEIRSPLTALRCKLDVAVRQPRTSEEYRQVIETSLQDIARLSTLVESLLLLARADADNLNIEFREVSVGEVLASVHEQLMPVAESRGIDFQFNRGQPCIVYGDWMSLHRAFRNIAENALKYTPAGGRVSIGVTTEGDYIRTCIEDTGVGIAPEEQSRIFRRFYRVDHARSRNEGGMGLGLAISDQIIRAHQGRIEVQSESGRGTRFTIFLASAMTLLEEV